MKFAIFQIDAFASNCFEGNPAAVCPLDSWLPDSILQAIAMENNLSDTAFFVSSGDDFELRWFTPVSEVDLCGHATLASAAVIFNELNYEKEQIQFSTRSGSLRVRRRGSALQMELPAQVPEPCAVPTQLIEAIGEEPAICLKHADLIAVYESEDTVRRATPNIQLLSEIDCRGIIITASATQYDFVLRWFGPRMGIDEDPVTGSAYTQVVPYWAQRMQKNQFTAYQASPRGGELLCELHGDRVLISGSVCKFMEGIIEI